MALPPKTTMVVTGEKTSVVAIRGVTGDPANDEITQIWFEVQKMVIRMAGGDPSKIDKQLDIDGVMRYLDQVQSSDQKAAEKHGTVKKAFDRTLQCISKVGGIIADGASYAFAPANTCFNALTFVIAAWQSYSAVFESLAELLEKCAQFLERLLYYDEMDATLRKVACCQLKLFVDVCDRTLQLKPKRRKIEMFFRQLLLDDDFIKDLLGQMENLNAREHRLVSAQTYKISQDAAKSSQEAAKVSKESGAKLDSLIESSAAQKQDKMDQQFKSKVQEAFFGKNAKDIEKWETTLRKNRALLIQDTGKWLDDDALFTSWVSSEDSDPILGIEGGDGSGKTLLATHAITRLQTQRGVIGTSARSAVAYYFFETDSKEDSKAAFAKKQVVQSVSKSLLWQLAQTELPYLKSIAGICDKVNFEDPTDVWTQLLLENEDRLNIESTFFLVLDGLGDNIDGLASFLQRVSKDAPRLRTRVMLTGNQNTFEKLEEAGGIRLTKMTLGLRNSQDIELYIKARMDAMDILKDTSRPGVADTRALILDRLMTVTSGDYYITNSTLSSIERADSLQEIEDCLEKAGNARPKQILEDIRKLNLTLKSQEIKEVNEIILWVKWAFLWIAPSLIEAALELKDDSASSDRQISLRSLESKIRDKYSLLFSLDDHRCVNFSAEEMLDTIPLKRYRLDDPNHTKEEEILPAELNIVRHYLSTVCPKDVYDKFAFEEFFAQKLERKTNYIYQDPDNAHITLALRCLRYLVEEKTEKTKELRSYAPESLFRHLEATDLSLADRELKAQTGVLLVRLFTEESAIEALLARDYGPDWTVMSVFDLRTLPPHWDHWVFSNVGFDLIEKWSGDSTVLENLTDKDALKNLANYTAGGGNWYEKAAKSIVKTFLDPNKRREEMEDAFTLLYGLIKRMNEIEEQRKQEFEYNEDDIWRPDMKTFQSVETWSKTELGVEDDNALWEAQMARLLYYFEFPGSPITKEDCEKRARRAIELNPDDWFAAYNLTRTFGSGRDAEAISILESIVERLDNDTSWRTNKLDVESFGYILEDLGNRYWEMPDGSGVEKAIQLYVTALNYYQTGHWGYAEIIANKLGERRDWARIIEYCETLRSFSEDGITLAGKVVFQGTMTHARAFWHALQNACHETNRWDLLTTLWKDGIDKAECQPREPYWAYQIRIWYANCLVRRPGYEDVGIVMLEGLFKENSVKEQIREVFDGLASILMPTYTKRAFKKDASIETKNDYIAKVMGLRKAFEPNWLMSDTCLLRFARFYHLQGDDAEAKNLLRDFAAQRLEMLSDDDLSNDYASFMDLSHLFTVFMDEANLVACWEMMAVSRIAERKEYEGKLEEWRKATELPADNDDEPANNKAEAQEKPIEPESWVFFCSEDCGFDTEVPSGIWICTNCVTGTRLDDTCYDNLATRGVKDMTCSINHSFYQLPSCDKASIEAIPPGSIRIGGKFVSLESWKAEVKAVYVDSVEGVSSVGRRIGSPSLLD